MQIIYLFVISALAVFSSACTATPVVEDPGKEITVEEALGSIGRGFAKMDLDQIVEEDGKSRRVPTGLIATEASIVLNLKASSESNNKLVVDLTRTIPESSKKIGGTIGGTSEATETTERGNVISIKMVSSLSQIDAKTTIKECVTKPDQTETCKTTVKEGKTVDTLKQWSQYLSESPHGTFDEVLKPSEK